MLRPRPTAIADAGDFAFAADDEGRRYIVIGLPTPCAARFEAVRCYLSIAEPRAFWDEPGPICMWDGDTERPTLAASIQTEHWHGWLRNGELVEA